MNYVPSTLRYILPRKDQCYDIPLNFNRDDFINSSGLPLTSRCWYVALCKLMSAGDKSEDYERSEQLLQDKLDHLGYTKEQLKAMLLHGVRPHNQENFYSSLGLKNIAIDFDEDFFRQINRLLNQYGPIIWNRSALGGDGFHSQVISGITHVNSEINVLEINDSMSQGTKSVPLQYYTGETIEELYEQGGMKFWISERKYWFNPFSSFLSYPEYCRDIRGEMPVV